MNQPEELNLDRFQFRSSGHNSPPFPYFQFLQLPAPVSALRRESPHALLVHESRMSSQAQIAANRANSQLSTGPASPEGKAKSSHNAVKTGLTGQTVLLPSDSVEAYEAHLARHREKFQPATDEERELVQAIADTEWRLLRITTLESNMLAVARHKLADLYSEVSDPAVRASLIEGEIPFVYKKDFANLSLQETRLLRRRKLETEALEKLQTPRKEAEAARRDMQRAVDLFLQANRAGHRFVPELFGFEFSESEVEEEVDKLIFKNNMIGKANGMNEAEYEEQYWRLCGQYYPE